MSGITVYQSDLTGQAAKGIINQKQASDLWTNLSAINNERWNLTWVHLGYALGGFLIAGSLTWFTSIVWDQHSLGLFFLSLLYTVVFGYAGVALWHPNSYNIPQIVGGIFMFVSVCSVPISVYGLEKYADWWPENTPGLFRAASLVVSSLVGVWLVPWPFLTAPLYWALFYIVEVDLAPLIFGQPINELPTVVVSWVSVIFGFAICASSFGVDLLKFKKDYSFWGYLFGLLALSGGLSYLNFNIYQNSGWFGLGYLIFNIVLASLSVPLRRLAFVIFGGSGVIAEIAYFLFTEATLEQDGWFNVGFGGVLIAVGYYGDNKYPQYTFPFWAYFFGVTTLWCGWSLLFSAVYATVTFALIYFFVNVLLLVASALTKQRVFLVYGTIGILWDVSELASIYFVNSLWLPLILTLLGLAIIALAIYTSNSDAKKRMAALGEGRTGGDVELQTIPQPMNVFSFNGGNISYPVVYYAPMPYSVPVTGQQ